VRDRAGLGQAVYLAHSAAHPLGQFLFRLRAQRRGAAHDVPQGREVPASHGRVADERQCHRRHHVAARHGVTFQQIKELPGLEAGNGDDCCSCAQPGVHDPGQPGQVEERQRGEHHVVGGQGEQGLALDHVGDQVAVAEHHSLAQPGRAARIRDRGDVVGRMKRHVRRRAGVAEQPCRQAPSRDES
jgi:hypothetical protein